MKTDYSVVAAIRGQLDNTGKFGFAAAANAWLEEGGSFDRKKLWHYMNEVFKLPRHLFGEFLHHFRIAVETEILWRRRESPPRIVEDYLNGATLRGME